MDKYVVITVDYQSTPSIFKNAKNAFNEFMYRCDAKKELKKNYLAENPFPHVIAFKM